MTNFSVATIGYQGRSLNEFVEVLQVADIETVVDVRLTPLSRLRGFSKSALCAALEDRSIVYVHDRRLGNPKENRPGFAADDTRPAAIKIFQAHLNNGSRHGFDELADRVRTQRVVLLCFEASHEHCHRAVIASQLEAELSRPVLHL